MTEAKLPSNLEMKAFLESKGFEAESVEVYSGEKTRSAAIDIKFRSKKDADDLFDLLSTAPMNVAKTPHPEGGWVITLTPLT